MDKPCTYKGMYECDCDNLTRRMPFRKLFTEHVIQHIKTCFPNKKQRLVYVSQGPGGLLFDHLLLKELVHKGYQQISVIFIEELYQEKETIIQACLDFKQWCSDCAPQTIITPYFFLSMNEYAQACSRQPELRGNVFVIVDPDTETTMPDFESIAWRTQFIAMAQTILCPRAYFYILFYRNKQRHMIMGQIQQAADLLIAYHHTYGHDSLNEQSHNRVFINTTEVLPFESISYGVQIGDAIQQSKELAHLLQDPLSINK